MAITASLCVTLRLVLPWSCISARLTGFHWPELTSTFDCCNGTSPDPGTTSPGGAWFTSTLKKRT